MAKYQQVYIFTKRTTMREFCDTDRVLGRAASQLHADRLVEFYAREREVQLICMFRWERTTKGTKCFCKIKCPINPLPVRGEFETPGSTTPVIDFLKANRWEFKQKFYPEMFE